MIREISSDSLSNTDKFCSGVIPEASNNLSQYFVSRASLRAILYLCIKSALLSAACASSTFAPIEVPARRTCEDRTFTNEDFLSSLSASFIISIANLKVRSTISLLFVKYFCSFSFYLLPFHFCLIELLSRRRGHQPGWLSNPFCLLQAILVYWP